MNNTNKKHRYLVGLGMLLVTLVSAYAVRSNPSLNLGDLTSVADSTASSVDVYIPNYTATVGEEGLIEIIAKDDVATFDAATFTLNYSPVDALSFDGSPIIFDADTQFQSAAFQMTATPEAGQLIVTIVLDDPLTLAAQSDVSDLDDVTLFKLETLVNASLPDGQVINLSVEDFALLNGPNPVVAVGPPSSTITTASTNELKVLNATALDSTHVALEFSDFITNLGLVGNYDLDPALNVNLVEYGTGYGFDQKTVVLTTDPQSAGQEYTITVDPASTIASNQEGSIDANFSNTIFYGFGDGSGVISDFNLVSASVTDYTTINAVFSDAVEAASVTASDFNLQIQETGAFVAVSSATASGSQVQLTSAVPLLKDNTYILSTNAASSVLRDSDSAVLGITETAFNGAKNGPRLIAATVTEQVGPVYRLQLTFDETLTVVGPNNAIGGLYQTGGAVVDTTIDDLDAGTFNQTVSGTTITLENALFNDANQNFIFSVNDPSYITNSQGVSIDDTYNAISFWGYNHDNSANSISSLDVTRKDQLLLTPGTLDETDGSLNYNIDYINAVGTVVNEPISSANVVGTNVEIITTNTLDPDRHYVLRVDNGVSVIAAQDFVVEKALNLVSAEAVSNGSARIYFSENIDERDVDAGDFLIETDADIALPITALTVDPSFQSVTLDVGSLTAGQVFQATVTGDTDVYSFEGEAVLKNTAFFTGFNTLGAQSPVTLNTVEVVDAQTLRFTFSGALDLTSFTPVNLDIFYFDNPVDPTSRADLVVSSVNQVSSTVYELSTAVQTPLQNYYILFDGVEDTNGLLIGNMSPVNFFGFELPEVAINLVSPSSLENDTETNVVLTGQNLDLVQELRIGTQTMTIAGQSANSLTFTVPASFEAGLYDIGLVDNASNLTTFDDALLVTVPTVDLTVHSAQSQAIPLSVPNNGETTTTLWLLVEDPVGLSSISSVVVDLSQIGGPSTAEMNKDGGTQPLNSQWYTYETTVPATVATQNDPYLLPVEVRKGAVSYPGTISVRVTNDVTASVAPVVNQVYASPISVPPDGSTPVKISAQVTDQDGAQTINSVVADLGALGIGFVPLNAISEVSEGIELETQFYESETFTVPETTALGTYDINVIASDNTGEQGLSTIQLQVSTSATGPSIDGDVSYISPRSSVPNDGTTAFSLHAFVSDTNGISDIQSVTATFGSIGLPPASLSQDTSLGASGESAWYSITNLTVPSTAPIGVHDIEIIATDSTGGLSNQILKLEVTHKDTLGDAPRIIADRAYTTPKVAVNDGLSQVTLYAFVQDDDDDIESVVVNLSDIGQVGEETAGTLGQSDDSSVASGNCPTGSNVIVCMQPSVKEGDNGQWFILPGVTISELTPASSSPYQVSVIATDQGGKTNSGTIPVYVGAGEDILSQQEAPRVLAAIPTGENSLEVLFSKEMSATSIIASSQNFKISSNSDINEILPVVGATINPAGNIVTLDTAPQQAGKAYVLSVSNEVKDIAGRGVLEGAANRLSFSGFEYLNKSPIVEYITATDVDLLEVEFRNNLKPTSAAVSNISIYESGNTTNKLDVLSVKVLAPGNILQVQTAPQEADVRYRINMENLASYDGTSLPVPLNKGFVGYNLTVANHAAAANFADLNSDGRVDFTDFTIFSSVYGTIYGAGGAAQPVPATGSSNASGQPLGSTPDATVPTTSVPAGGAIN